MEGIKPYARVVVGLAVTLVVVESKRAGPDAGVVVTFGSV
jgi:hypothetical protein